MECHYFLNLQKQMCLSSEVLCVLSHAYLSVELTELPCTFSPHWLLLHFCRSSLGSPNTNQWWLCLINNQASSSRLIISLQVRNSLIINGTYRDIFQWPISKSCWWECWCSLEMWVLVFTSSVTRMTLEELWVVPYEKTETVNRP